MAKISVHTDKVVVLIAVDKNGNNYPEIGVGNFKGALWTFIQWLALKMREHYGISIVFPINVLIYSENDDDDNVVFIITLSEHTNL